MNVSYNEEIFPDFKYIHINIFEVCIMLINVNIHSLTFAVLLPTQPFVGTVKRKSSPKNGINSTAMSGNAIRREGTFRPI